MQVPRTQFFKELSHAMVASLRYFTEFIVGSGGLSSQPVWLLGTLYGISNHDTGEQTLVPEIEAVLLADLAARLWFTYRRDFPPLGALALTSDIGWGCTLRSGQMLLAEALLRHGCGRLSRRPPAGSPAAARVSDVVRLFLDDPDARQHPFSIHALCAAGAAAGVVPGQWLGPWVLCRAVEAAVADQPQLGLRVHVLGDPGGGAPTLMLHRAQALLAAPADPDAAVEAAPAAPHVGEAGVGREAQPSSAAGPAGTSHRGDDEATAATAADAPSPPGLLVLVPLTLGVGRVDARYLTQLRQLLTFPQSVGILGGRPGSSLFFMGTQGEGLLFLDPHEAQQAVALPEGLDTYFCTSVRVMPLAGIDPSLAIGLYCASPGELTDLAERLQRLAASAGSTPLISVATADAPTLATYASEQASTGAAAREHGTDDWELV